MTDPQEHLNYTTSDRGFDIMPTLKGKLPNESVRVYESSAASGPYIWLAVSEPLDRNRPTIAAQEVMIELSTETAQQLIEQLQHLVANHYQNGYSGEEVKKAWPDYPYTDGHVVDNGPYHIHRSEETDRGSTR